MFRGRRSPGASLLVVALGAWLGTFVPTAHAQSDASAAPYCEPAAGTKLLYSNRAYEIEQKSIDAPLLYYTYKILAPSLHSQFVERRGQLLFDDGEDRWEVLSKEQEIKDFWPLQPGRTLVLRRFDRATRVKSKVHFQVLGLEPIDSGTHVYQSWKISRLDENSDGTHFQQFLWYAPEICTLSAFTDSQHRTVRLLRVLKPGDADYDRSLTVKQHRLYFADSNEVVK
jgi:hypothetical protein